MKSLLDTLCPCVSPARPFVLAIGAASALTYLTWLGLGFLSIAELHRLSAALAAFLVFGALLLLAAVACLQRCQGERIRDLEGCE